MMLAPLLHPMLSRLPAGERRSALQKARRTPLDILELVGMAAGLIVGIVVMRGGLDSLGDAGGGWSASSAQDIIGGAAFCSALIALLLLRRTRRGLRRVLDAEQAP